MKQYELGYCDCGVHNKTSLLMRCFSFIDPNTFSLIMNQHKPQIRQPAMFLNNQIINVYVRRLID